jgi:hypothetical protein
VGNRLNRAVLGTYPPISWGAKSLLKSPNLSGDLGGSILAKLQNLRSIDIGVNTTRLGENLFPDS